MKFLSFFSTVLVLTLAALTGHARETTLGTLVLTSDEQNLTLRFPFPELTSSITTDALLCAFQGLPAATHVSLVSPSGAIQVLQTNIVSANCYELKQLSLLVAGGYFLKTDRATFPIEVSTRPTLDDVSIFSIQTTEGAHGVLQFASKVLSSQTTDAVFCPGSLGSVVGASLWMPDMGHGSSPVTLTNLANGCTKISKMDFFMTGAWDVRVTLSNGTKFVFPVTIQ